MSSKTHTRKTRTTTASTSGSTRALRSVPEPTTVARVGTETEDKLWEALHANPNSTAANLSSVAKIGKSTAQKILVKWAGDGSVTRTPGIAEGGRRAADLWAITEVDAEPTDNDPANANPANADATEPTDAAPTDPADAEPMDSDPSDADATEPTDAEPIDAEPTDTYATDPANTDTAAESANGGTTTVSDADEKAPRLAPGALRGMVEDYLRDHPGEEFSPSAIGKALDRSSGAVNNALEKLASDGTAVKSKEAPKRFALAPAEQEAASEPTK